MFSTHNSLPHAQLHLSQRSLFALCIISCFPSFHLPTAVSLCARRLRLTEQVNKNIQTWLREALLQSAEVSHLSVMHGPIRVSLCIWGEASKLFRQLWRKALRVTLCGEWKGRSRQMALGFMFQPEVQLLHFTALYNTYSSKKKAAIKGSILQNHIQVVLQVKRKKKDYVLHKMK